MNTCKEWPLSAEMVDTKTTMKEGAKSPWSRHTLANTPRDPAARENEHTIEEITRQGNCGNN